MVTMLMSIEDEGKVNKIKKFAQDNKISINFEKNDVLWIKVNGDAYSINKLYNMMLKINSDKSNFLTKLKSGIVKIFE